MTNKKGFEMSINTIVILVIAVTMLILGIVLVKTIMCGAMDLAATTNQGALDQINRLFTSGETKEATCMGKTNPLDIVPGEYNVVGCGLKPKTQTNFSYIFTLKSAIDSDGNQIQNVNAWIRESRTGSKIVAPGDTELVAIGVEVPEDAPEGTLVFGVLIKKGTTVVTDADMRLRVKRVGFIQKGIC